jgi:hypothetical protein
MYPSFAKRFSYYPGDYRRVSFSENRRHSFRSEPDGGSIRRHSFRSEPTGSSIRASGDGMLSTPHGRIPIGSLVAVGSPDSYLSNGGRGGDSYNDVEAPVLPFRIGWWFYSC